MPELRRLKGLRVERGLTQRDLSTLIGMPLSTYSRKEIGETQFSLDEAYKISLILEKTIDDIFFNNQVPKQEHKVL